MQHTVFRFAPLLLETEVLPSPGEVVRSRRISSKKLKNNFFKEAKKNITDISEYTSSTYVCLLGAGSPCCTGTCVRVGLGSLGLQGRDEVLALAGLHRPALLALVVQEQAVELLEVGHYVVLDVWDGDLQAHAAAIE